MAPTYVVPIERPLLLRYGIAIGVVVLALLLTLLIRPLIDEAVFALFFVAVIIATWYGGLGAGLLAIVLSLLLSNLVFSPTGTFDLDVVDLARLGVEGVAALIISSLTASRRRAEADLRAQREQYRVTLTSIGDAVITTDAEGRVSFLNTMAESLTGWSLAEASGRDIAEVFHIVNADTRQEVESPIRRVLREGAIVGLANHTLLIARDGAERPIDDSGAPIRDAAAAISGVVMVFRDISERARAEAAMERYQLLSEHAHDTILFVGTDGRIIEANRAALAAYGYSRDELLAKSIYDLRDETAAPLSREQLVQAHSEGLLFEAIHRRKDGSIFPVEVSSRGTTIEGQRVLLSIIRDITERKRAEAIQHFLAEAGKALNSSMDYPTRLEMVARLAVPHIADWCAIDLVADDGSFEQAVVAHVDPAKVAWAHELRRRYPLEPAASLGVPKVVRTGETEFHPEITDAMLQASARSPEELELARKIGFTSLIIAPLAARGRAFGAITFVTTESRRRYGDAEVALAEELARRAAVAIENARLYTAAQAAREQAERSADRLARLQAVTALLSGALTESEVVEIIAAQGRAALDARAGLVALVADDGAMLEIKYAIGYQDDRLDPFRSFPIGAELPVADAVRTRELVLLEAPEQRAARYPALAASGPGDFSAWAALPFVVEDRALGALGLSFDTLRSFSAEDRTFMLTLGRQCAQALERARLYEAELRARAEAEAAVHLRDQFLSIAAHELKTPLTSLLGNAQLMQRRAQRDGTLPEREQRTVRVIADQAARLNKMVLALLDISRLESGQLSIERAPLDLCALVRRVLDEVRPAIEERAIELAGPSTPLMIEGDELRLEQVLQNLIQNAIKYSPEGQPVQVQVAQQGQHVCVDVIDHGVGIPEAALPHLFQRFYRAPNVEARQISGMGVGLYVVKEIANLHGGEVHVASVEGAGSTFTVCFPLLAHPHAESGPVPAGPW